MMRELIGPAIQMVVAKAAIAEDDRGSIRSKDRLRLEQSMNADAALIIRGCLIPVGNNPTLFSIGQNRQLGDRAVGIRQD